MLGLKPRRASTQPDSSTRALGQAPVIKDRQRAPEDSKASCSKPMSTPSSPETRNVAGGLSADSFRRRSNMLRSCSATFGSWSSNRTDTTEGRVRANESGALSPRRSPRRSSCGDAPKEGLGFLKTSSSPGTFRGYLDKLQVSTISGAWRRRFIVVQEGRLMWFNDESKVACSQPCAWS